MARSLYWLVYYVDLGPLGPVLLDLAVKAWLHAHRAKTLRREAGWAMTPAWTPR
jgi:hypothetical protein